MRPKKKITKKEERALKMLSSMPTKKVSYLTGVPFGRLRSLQVLHKINKNYFHWSEEDYTKLKKLWGILPSTEIAVTLGRSQSQISLKAKKLGLR